MFLKLENRRNIKDMNRDATPAEANTEIQDLNILIVDDEIDTRMLLKDLLETEGLTHVISVATAEEAFQLLGLSGNPSTQTKVDLILMDVEMPGLNGIEACLKIKSTPHLIEIPIIMITVRSDVNDVKSAFDAGASDYVTKPFRRVELLARIRSALLLKRELDRRKEHESQLVELTLRLQEANRALERLTLMDGVTGIANRRFLELVLDREWRRTVRQSLHLSLVMIDIDHFKLFNDTYGHRAGDDCLRRVGRAMAETLKRPGDILGRYGGEEFLAVLPDTHTEDATAIAKSLQQSVNALGIPHSASSSASHVTVSLGLATSGPPRYSDLERIVERADKAMYQAKAGGRNRLVLYTDDMK